MATILLQAAGAYLGGMLGSFGAVVGTAAGALAGYAVDRMLLNGTNTLEGPRLSGPRPFSAEEGVPIPRVYGTARIGGTMIWATRFSEKRTSTRQGKTGPKVNQYFYYANAAFLLCEGEIACIRRIWADGVELDRETIDLRVYTGSEDQLPDPLIEAKQGIGNTPAYRGVTYVVLDRLPISQYGNRIPQLQFEVIRPVGDLAKSVRAISLIPGATEYGLSSSLISLLKRPGSEEATNRHVLFAATDMAASLDELQATCPNLEHVALIVTWFGNDLRAGHCQVRPEVTEQTVTAFSADWTVSGLSRAEAALVSTHDGLAAYGGTPSDRSVLDAIADLKARGLKVTLYPFVMMDIPEDNALPDPYGGSNQAGYPWRGRITSDPAPEQAGTADKTAASRSQISAFCGDSLPGHFSNGSNTINYSGPMGDWGYRRFVLHYAHLAVKAGGVDTFLIGSEMRGLTTLRDEADAFPFVEQQCTLAADVRSVLGPQPRLTYAADWSEYFGHQPADGSGDVYFHLDPLWAHPAIDAVGIDNYMPLADWRDQDNAGGNPDGFASPYDIAGLQASITGGEGFDWYYADSEARATRTRTPITDDGYGKPWVFRNKDLAAWWSNQHFNRPAGIEGAVPTAWVPQGKPIWFTEIGCPAMDKGPNQPNVFPDPKSAESAIPYFSNGGRSDVAQRRFLEAHLTHWEETSGDFHEEWNPQSGVYDGRMVDVSRIYPWTWDARPFPAFPSLRDVWSDGANWDRGHWLNGRLANPDVGALINAILIDHGHAPAEVSNVEGTLTGYVLDDPQSARAALEPLMDIFDVIVSQDGDTIAFRQLRASSAATVSELAWNEAGPMIETVRVPEHELPSEALLTFREPFSQYQVASVRSVQQGISGSRQHSMAFPGILEANQARALLDDWLKRTRYVRETVRFAVPLPQADIAPGTAVRLPASGNGSDFLVTDVEDGLLRTVSARQILAAPPTPWRSSIPAAFPVLSAAIGKPHTLFLDLPAGIGSNEAQDQFRVALWQTPWVARTLSVSPEDTGFAVRATVGQPARLGKLTEPLLPGFEGRIAKTTSISVELFESEVASVSRLQLLNGANTAAVRSASGAWEILQFETAEQVGAEIWKLSGLLRGQLGTDDAMLVGASSGADFVLLDDAVVPAGLLVGEIGLQLNWRVDGSFIDSLIDNAATEAVGGVRALTPLSPVHLKAHPANGDLAVSWVRRGRIDADRWDGSDIPLGEDVEQYRIEIAPADGAIVRTATAFEPSWLYEAASIAADFATAGEIDVTVRQFSTAVGWGVPARRRFTLP